MSRLMSSLALLACAISIFGLCSVLGEQKAVTNVEVPYENVKIGPYEEVFFPALNLNGIYQVTFSSPDGKKGTGIVVISGGAVNGGDPAYTYQGSISSAGSELKTSIEVVRYNPGEPIFGPLDNFQLELDGEIQEGGKAFTASGYVKSQPALRIKLVGTWVRALIMPQFVYCNN
ncbi:GrlR family regulatory protein [Candidatus Electronema sp. PJ]|uniref:GrlR family regulatory protein n=1 Tax=Candidatus Electronema sp. PJ TaxID=3401572 RepID=UPI003AA9702B